MEDKNVKWPTHTEVIRETLEDLGKVIDVKQTLKEFVALQFEE